MCQGRTWYLPEASGQASWVKERISANICTQRGDGGQPLVPRGRAAFPPPNLLNLPHLIVHTHLFDPPTLPSRPRKATMRDASQNFCGNWRVVIPDGWLRAAHPQLGSLQQHTTAIHLSDPPLQGRTRAFVHTFSGETLLGEQNTPNGAAQHAPNARHQRQRRARKTDSGMNLGIRKQK